MLTSCRFSVILITGRCRQLTSKIVFRNDECKMALNKLKYSKVLFLVKLVKGYMFFGTKILFHHVSSNIMYNHNSINFCYVNVKKLKEYLKYLVYNKN